MSNQKFILIVLIITVISLVGCEQQKNSNSKSQTIESETVEAETVDESDSLLQPVFDRDEFDEDFYIDEMKECFGLETAPQKNVQMADMDDNPNSYNSAIVDDSFNEMVDKALHDDFDFDVKNLNSKMGETNLHRAALAGDLNKVKELVKQGANINAKTNDIPEETVLQYAAKSGNLQLVQWLIEHGADVNPKCRNTETVLHYAVESGNLELVKWLVKNGGVDINAEYSEIPFPWHIEDSDNIPTSRNTVISALHIGADKNNWEMVKLLVELGYDIDTTNFPGDTVLHCAAKKKEWEMVKWLINHGANINKRDHNADTVLHIAVKSEPLELIQWLIEHGADVNMKNKAGDTILIPAKFNPNPEVYEWLRKHGNIRLWGPL